MFQRIMSKQPLTNGTFLLPPPDGSARFAVRHGAVEQQPQRIIYAAQDDAFDDEDDFYTGVFDLDL